MKKIKQTGFPEGLLKTYFGDDRILEPRKKKDRVINDPAFTKRSIDVDCVTCSRKEKP